MQTYDKQLLANFSTGAPAMATTTPTTPTTTTTHWPHVKQILDGLIADWTAANGTAPNLRGKHNDPNFGWATKDQLKNSKGRGFQLIQPGVAGKDTNLVKALTTGVGGFPQMPDGGPYLTDPDPKYKGQLDYIIKWIDEGMPD
jgi:hypothetical protein